MDLNHIKSALPDFAKDLRLNLESVLSEPGAPCLDKASFELAAMAVSAINGCAACMDSHERVLRAHGITAQGVQSAVRIAAVLHAVAVTLEQTSPMPLASAA